MSIQPKQNRVEELSENSEYRQMKEQSARIKKKIKMILLAAVFLLAVLLLILYLTKDKETGEGFGDLQFDSPYTGEILSYESYLEMDRSICYCADPSGYGETLSITEENRAEFSREVLYLCDLVEILIRGDHEAYNACLGTAYKEERGTQPPFSQQMIYETRITYHTEEKAEDGVSRFVTYKLEYKLLRNDGSYRTDVERNESRPQYFTLLVTPDGQICIYNIEIPVPKS